MTLDHIALRVGRRAPVVQFLALALGYRVQEEFKTDLAESTALVHPTLPTVFVSAGAGIGNWVYEHEGVHHIAFRTDDLNMVVNALRAKGVQFTTSEIIENDDLSLRQIFTRPFAGGVCLEFLERTEDQVGFDPANVRQLMASDL